MIKPPRIKINDAQLTQFDKCAILSKLAPSKKAVPSKSSLCLLANRQRRRGELAEFGNITITDKGSSYL
jgi:hypothetical protein